MVDAARLRRSTDIAKVRSAGRAKSDRYVSIRALDTDLGLVRLAVSAMRGAGTSVSRNRARRRVREALRVELSSRETAPSVDLMVAARPAVLDAPWSDLRESVRRALDGAFAAR